VDQIKADAKKYRARQDFIDGLRDAICFVFFTLLAIGLTVEKIL